MPPTPASGTGAGGRPVLIPGMGWAGLVDTFTSSGRLDYGDATGAGAGAGPGRGYSNGDIPGAPQTPQGSPLTPISLPPGSPGRGKDWRFSRKALERERSGSMAVGSSSRDAADSYNTYTGFRQSRDRRRAPDPSDVGTEADEAEAEGLGRNASDECLADRDQAQAQGQPAQHHSSVPKVPARKARKQPASRRDRAAKFSQYVRPDIDAALLSPSAAQMAINVWKIVPAAQHGHSGGGAAYGRESSGGGAVGGSLGALGARHGSLEDGDTADAPSHSPLSLAGLGALLGGIFSLLFLALRVACGALASLAFWLFRFCYKKVTKRRDVPGCPVAVLAAAAVAQAHGHRLWAAASRLLGALYAAVELYLTPPRHVAISDPGCRDSSGANSVTAAGRVRGWVKAGLGARRAGEAGAVSASTGGPGLGAADRASWSGRHVGTVGTAGVGDDRAAGYRGSLADGRDSLAMGQHSHQSALASISALYSECANSYLAYALLTCFTGANVVPLGGRHVRRLIRASLLCLSTSDIGLFVLLFIFGKVALALTLTLYPKLIPYH